MHVKKSNCGASVKSSQKPKKMNSGGFMKIGGDLQKLDVNKREEKGMYGGGMARKKKSASPNATESGRKKPLVKPKPKPKPKKRMGPTRMSSGGMAEKKREEKAKEEGKEYKKGELVEAKHGKYAKKKK